MIADIQGMKTEQKIGSTRSSEKKHYLPVELTDENGPDERLIYEFQWNWMMGKQCEFEMKK